MNILEQFASMSRQDMSGTISQLQTMYDIEKTQKQVDDMPEGLICKVFSAAPPVPQGSPEGAATEEAYANLLSYFKGLEGDALAAGDRKSVV